jgi:hypothetical protein
LTPPLVRLCPPGCTRRRFSSAFLSPWLRVVGYWLTWVTWGCSFLRMELWTGSLSLILRWVCLCPCPTRSGRRFILIRGMFWIWFRHGFLDLCISPVLLWLRRYCRVVRLCYIAWFYIFRGCSHGLAFFFLCTPLQHCSYHYSDS